MKNAFQELKSTNEDQASCEIQDLEESSNRRNGRFKKRNIFWIPLKH